MKQKRQRKRANKGKFSKSQKNCLGNITAEAPSLKIKMEIKLLKMKNNERNGQNILTKSLKDQCSQPFQT